MSDDLENFEDFEDDVGLGAEDKKHARSNQLDWFKGEKGRSYRVALVYFHPLDANIYAAMKKQNPSVGKAEIAEKIKAALAKRAGELSKSVDQLAPYEKLDTSNVRFKKIVSHYKDGVGYVISRLGKDGPEADVIWKMMGDPKSHFTTVLLIYPTNREGELIKEQLATGWNIMPWRFGTKVYATFHTRSTALRENNLSIASQDLKLTCTNTDFQNFDIDVAGPSLWTKSPGFSSKVLAKAQPLYEKLVPFRELSTADLKIKLGIGGGSAATEDGVSDDDFKGLLDEV
jgi:hypothetical protein